MRRRLTRLFRTSCNENKLDCYRTISRRSPLSRMKRIESCVSFCKSSSLISQALKMRWIALCSPHCSRTSLPSKVVKMRWIALCSPHCNKTSLLSRLERALWTESFNPVRALWIGLCKNCLLTSKSPLTNGHRLTNRTGRQRKTHCKWSFSITTLMHRFRRASCTPRWRELPQSMQIPI